MNKTIIVFTTRYIGEEYLFSPNCHANAESILLDQYLGLQSFWANRFCSIIKLQKGKRYIKEFVTAEDLSANNINAIEDLKGLKLSKFYQQKIEAILNLEPRSIVHTTSLIAEEHKKVYHLNCDSEDIELYAINHLPKELSLLIDEDNEAESTVKQQWLDAIIKSFYKDGFSLYIIMHGSTDCPASNESPEFIDRGTLLDNITIGEEIKKRIKVASFQHEDTARIAQLLSMDMTDANKIVYEIERCFDEYHIVGSLKKIFDSLIISADQIDEHVYLWLQKIEKYKNINLGDYRELDAAQLIRLINKHIV